MSLISSKPPQGRHPKVIKMHEDAWITYILYRIGLINFGDTKFRGFRGYLLNHEIKYPHIILAGRFFVWEIALWK